MLLLGHPMKMSRQLRITAKFLGRVKGAGQFHFSKTSVNTSMTITADENPLLQSFSTILFLEARTAMDFFGNQVVERQQKFAVAKQAQARLATSAPGSNFIMAARL